MSKRTYLLCFALIGILISFAPAGEWKSGIVWEKPEVVDPGETDDITGMKPPKDAVVLFDGKDMSAWDGGEKWIIEDGAATTAKGGVRTKQKFGSCRLHIEFASPEEVKGSGQGRGNSGVYLMGKYEVQILDSYENETYYDGQCGAIYKQSPPKVNACRGPGKWQSYDITFTAPKFNDDGSVKSPARLTVIHNGIKIQDDFQLKGDTAWHRPPEYKAHPDKLPISLQYHGNKVRFRNIWLVELDD